MNIKESKKEIGFYWAWLEDQRTGEFVCEPVEVTKTGHVLKIDGRWAHVVKWGPKLNAPARFLNSKLD